MKKILRILIIMSTLVLSVWADGLSGVYYNNTTWSNPSVLSQTDATINVNWGNGSPNAAVSSNNFSAKWTGYIYVPETANYTFYASHDDYMDITIDGTSRYSNATWTGGAGNYNSFTINNLSQGYHTIQIRFIEYTGGAYISFAWKNNASITTRTVVSSSNLFTAIPTPPTLSSISINPIGSTTASLNATPSATGTLYYVLTQSATAPSIAQVKAGLSNTGAAALFSGNSVVTASTAQTFNLTGLTSSTTYYPYLVITDSTLLDSASVYTPTPSSFKTLPIVSITDQNLSEGNTTAITNSIVVTLSAASSTDTDVYITTADYSAISPTDYTGVTNLKVTIPAGQTSASVPIEIKGDHKYAPDKAFTITLSNPVNATLGNSTATVTILNDDYAPTINITPTLSISEGGTGTKLATLSVSLTGSSDQTISATYTTSDITATSTGTLLNGGADYIASTGVVTFLPGETTKDITFTINGDMVYEPDETFGVTLSDIQNAIPGNLLSTVTLTNDDAIPTLSINNVSANEGNSATSPFVFTVSASGSSWQPFTFSYSTRDSTAKSFPYAPDSFGATQPYALLYNPGKQDYNATNGVITFSPGETTKTISVNVIGNTIFEPNKIFYVDIVSANGANISPTAKSGKGTIVNDDTSFAGPNVRDFKTVYSNTLNGNVRIFGNTAMVKNATGCTTGTESACNPGTSRNNDVNVKFTKVDSSVGAPSTNSSADLSTALVPVGSTVKWAGLYWQGYLCGDEKSASSQKPNTVSVKLKRPGDASYQTLQADTLNWVYFANNGSCNGGTERWYYQGNKDITSIINTSAPQGTYYVGDIVSQLGQPAGGSFGGWSIVLVYENSATETIKNVVVYDGYMGIGSGADLGQKGVLNTFSTNLSGFVTPRKSPISSTFLWFAGEGDLGATGDAVSLTKSNNTAVSLTNTTNPASDIANSTITYKNAYVTNRAPNWQNTIGLDIDDFDISSILSPCQSQTKATLTSSGDGYFPGLFAFSTEVAQGTACYNEGAVFNFVSTGKVTDGKDNNSPAYENALLTQVMKNGTSSIDLLAKREYQPNGLVSDTQTLMSYPGYKGLVHIDFVKPTSTACDQKTPIGSDYNLSFTAGYVNRLPVAINFPQIDTNLSARVRYLVNDSGFAEPWGCDTLSTSCILDYLVTKRGASVCLNECNASVGGTLSQCMACVFDSAKTITAVFPSDPNSAIPVNITDKTKLSRVACSADTFAVRPDRFVVTSSKSVIYPGDTFTLTVTAVDALGNTVTAYAPSYNTTNFTTTVSGATTGSITGFTNGIATITVTAGAVTGNFSFSIAEKTPKEYAIVDANDGSGNSRFITNGSYTFVISPIITNLNMMMDECAWSDGVVGSVKDSSGRGLHGTPYYANTTASSGNFKSYRSGDFTTSNKAKIEINDNVLLRPNNLTAMLWFKPSKAQSSYTGVMMKGSTENWTASSKSWSDGYGFYVNNSSQLCFYVNKSSTASVCSTTSIATNVWMHGAATYDGEIIKLYINGNTTPQATKNYSSSTNLIDYSTGKVYIGSTPQSNGQFFKGYIDEVHLMDRALLPSQINGIYTNENSGNDLNGLSKPNASCNYSVNLSISKTPNNLSLLPGEAATFTLSATNFSNSGGTADNVTITDIVPSVLNISSVSSGCSISGQTVTCATSSLAKGDTISYSVNTTVGSSATSGTYTNTANILCTQDNNASRSSSVNFTVLNNPKFDAFDTANFTNKKLYTRSVGQIATFPIYSLNQTTTATQPYTSSLVGVRVVDAASCPSGGSGAWSDVNLSSGLASFSYTPTKAIKNLKLQFATKNSGYTDAMCSSDTYSVRPSSFSVSAALLRAGEELNATALNGGTGYNGNAAVLTKISTAKPACSTQTNFLLDNEQLTSLTFVADHNNNTMVAKDIGSIDLTLSDTSWTLEDKGNGDCDPNIIDGSIVNGKAGCDINTTLHLTINPYQLTTTRNSFSTSGTPNWLYLDSSRTQHVDINAHITAYDKLGKVTKNFSDGCFGSTVPLGFYFTPAGTLPVDVNLSLSASTGSQSSIKDISAPYTTPLFNTEYFQVTNSSFKNGDANLTLKFNFLRSSSKPINPFSLTLTKINTNDSTVALNTSASGLNDTATFVYGRARTYDIATDTVPVDAPVEFDVYSTASTGYVSGMLQTMPNWYRNAKHNGIGVGSVKHGGFSAGSASLDVTTLPANGIQMLKINSLTNQSVHLDIDPWLWYSPSKSYSYLIGSECLNHPCLDYRYNSSAGGLGIQSGSSFEGSDFTPPTPSKKVQKGAKIFR